MAIVTWTTSGSDTWTCPEGVTTATVECWGPGGNGGEDDHNGNGGGGGGGGAYARSSVGVTPGNGYAIFVGSAGSSSTFGGSTVVARYGDAGGPAWSGGTGGTGGSTALSTGDVKYAGGAGANASADVYGGGGGEGGRTGATGATATNRSGATGGDGGDGGNGGDGNASGSAGYTPGGGGGGGVWASGPTKVGGAGATGQVRITYYASWALVGSSAGVSDGGTASLNTSHTPQSVLLVGTSGDGSTGSGYLSVYYPFPPTIKVWIDWDVDGTYTDVTADVAQDPGVTWDRGRSADFSTEAQGSAAFTLLNRTGAYNPATNANVAPGKPVRITSTHHGTTYAHFTGFIERVTPDAWTARVEITCYDPMRLMSEVDVVVPPTTDPAIPWYLLQKRARAMRVDVLAEYERGNRNLLVNPAFATDLAGWGSQSGTFTRVSGDGPAEVGTTCAEYVFTGTPGVDIGAVWTTGWLTPVTYSGQTYRGSIWMRTTSGTATVRLSLGYYDATFPNDKTMMVTTAWTRYTVTYTPTETRRPGGSYFASTGMLWLMVRQITGTVRFSGATVTRGQALYPYSATGAGRWPNWCANGDFEAPTFLGWDRVGAAVNAAIGTWPIKWGFHSTTVQTDAVAEHGIYYDFYTNLTGFTTYPYTVSVWLYAYTAMPYRVRIKGNAGADSAQSTGTLTANTWTQVTVTWTPSADRPASTAGAVVLEILQTDATARTFFVDGVRVIPGSSADAFEMAQWAALTDETDVYAGTAALSGSALSAMDALNALTLSRHYIRPTLIAPYYQYVTTSRTDLATKTLAETMANDFSGFAAVDVDRNSIVNVVPITHGVPGLADKTEYYSDSVSVGAFGVHPGSAISGGDFYTDSTIPDVIGPSLVARYSVPRGRPTLERTSIFPSQLERDVDDLITVTVNKLGITAGKYLIVKVAHRVTMGGVVWRTTYTLEAYPY